MKRNKLPKLAYPPLYTTPEVAEREKKKVENFQKILMAIDYHHSSPKNEQEK